LVTPTFALLPLLLLQFLLLLLHSGLFVNITSPMLHIRSRALDPTMLLLLL
jgi:hypothetical protein